MTRGILLAGNESPLFSALATETEKRVEKYAAAGIRNPNPGPELSGEAQANSGSAKQIPLLWNPGSSISGRTLIVSAENRMGRINDAVLVCVPPALYQPAEALAPADIETQVNTQIKGWFFLVRELAVYFRAKGGGNLAMVIPDTVSGGRESQADLLGTSAAASFRALANGLLVSALAEPFNIFGFSVSETGLEADFASWLFKIIDESAKRNSGKWHKFSKFALFGR